MTDKCTHTSDCEWHVDQYPWECTCGFIPRKKAMDDLIAQDADLIDTVVTDADREVFIRLSGPDDEGANRIRRGLTYTWEVGLIARHRQAAYAAGYQAAADRIEALEVEVERLREALSWAEDADPVLADAIRTRAGLGEKRDLPECFGSIEVTHPQSRAENCCDDCPVEGLCRAALGEKQ